MNRENSGGKRARCMDGGNSSGGAAAGAKGEDLPGRGRRERTDPWGSSNSGTDDGRPWGSNDGGPDEGRPPVIVTALPAEAQAGPVSSRGVWRGQECHACPKK